MRCFILPSTHHDDVRKWNEILFWCCKDNRPVEEYTFNKVLRIILVKSIKSNPSPFLSKYWKSCRCVHFLSVDLSSISFHCAIVFVRVHKGCSISGHSIYISNTKSKLLYQWCSWNMLALFRCLLQAWRKMFRASSQNFGVEASTFKIDELHYNWNCCIACALKDLEVFLYKSYSRVPVACA